MVTMVWVADRN